MPVANLVILRALKCDGVSIFDVTTVTCTWTCVRVDYVKIISRLLVIHGKFSEL